jgi:hypothetical protein
MIQEAIMRQVFKWSLALALGGMLLGAGIPVWAQSSDKPGFHGWGDKAAPKMDTQNTDPAKEDQAPEAGTRGGISEEADIYERYDRERAAFQEDTRELRRRIYEKQQRLREELTKDSPDRDAALKLQREVSGLRSEFDQRRLEHAIRMRALQREAGTDVEPGYGSRGGYCPNCPYAGERRGDRPGYGKGRGYGMGPGGMHREWGRGERGFYEGDDDRRYLQSRGPVDRQTAREIVESYLRSTRNPNLKLGEIKDVGRGYEAEIVTQDNSPVDTLFVDKDSGMVSSVY